MIISFCSNIFYIQICFYSEKIRTFVPCFDKKQPKFIYSISLLN